jgi:hypothetical protein
LNCGVDHENARLEPSVINGRVKGERSMDVYLRTKEKNVRRRREKKRNGCD